MKKVQLILENESKTKLEKLEWGLYDTESALKVFALLEDTKRGSTMFPRIDLRQKHTVFSTTSLANEMNSVIYKINMLGEGCEIPDSLMLDLFIPPYEQVGKLNTLHEIFQQYTEQYGTDINETQVLLERVNIIVHMLEAGPVEIDQVFMVAKQEEVSRHLLNALDLGMSDDDHMERLPNALWGVLEMDYHTVGKDLGACFFTNDTELVEAGELRQQTQLTPCIAANFMTSSEWAPTVESDALQQQQFYEWCDNNNLDQYIDYTLPEYRLGRLRLGEITEQHTITDIQTLVIQYPSIKEIMLINDK
tara:strand:+ start:170 stop:1087 length:918 start_codon:yes stop_codon:yes gene_type:complete